MNIAKTKCRVVAALCAVSSAVALANPGDFDQTFNGVGFARDFAPGLFSDRLDLAVQLSGEIVTIKPSDSGPVLWRHLPDGTLDTRFGGTGTVFPPHPPDYLFGAHRIAIDNLNRIVFVGQVSAGHIVYRLNFDGTLDVSFGTSGTVRVPFGGAPFGGPPGMAIQSDNKIVGVGGTAGPSRFIAYRLDETGQLDPTFGGSGIVFTEVTPGGGVDRAWAVAVQADGKIVSTGRVRPVGPTGFDYALVRYLPTGALDPDFGNEGKVIIHILESNFGRKVAIQPDGKIVMTGDACTQADCSFGIPSLSATVRVDDRGILDPTFGGTGVVLTSLGGVRTSAEDVSVQPGGKLLVAGAVVYDDTRGVSNAILLRYLPDGSLDPSFGAGGVSETNYGYPGNGASTIGIQADGQIVVGASTARGSEVPPLFGVTARYQQ